MSEPVKALPEDIDFDPSYRRFRILASALLGTALNTIRGVGTYLDPPAVDSKKRADEIECLAVKHGILVFDDYHHAPACPANHWHKRVMPTGPCNCGAKP